MYSVLAVILSVVAGTFCAYDGPLAGGQPASLYPAGISPHACPNFPHCTNPSLAANPNAPAPPAQFAPTGYQQDSYSNQPTYNAENNNHQLTGAYTGDGDYHGEGLKESGAYGDISHSYNSETAPDQGQQSQYNAAPYDQAHHDAVHYAQAQPNPVPAGVDPQSCPSYPYC